MAQQPSADERESPRIAPDQPGGDGERGREVIARLADELLPTLIARLDASALGEVEVRQDGWRVRLRRAPGQPGTAASKPDSASPRRGDRRAERPSPERSGADQSAGARPQPLRPERNRRAVTSPAVGYYLPRDGLGAGTTVRAGDVLGHVDVLGVRQDVVAPEDGVVVALAAEPGEAVEYGQLLARIEPGRHDADREVGR
ncbi:MAG: hypothetical protein M3N29_01585 [Chloroflexota bacterium]|nr:hypothetical protein [Chloroflexota bacterium]